jgi:serine/threonine-protein kinase PRP4
LNGSANGQSVKAEAKAADLRNGSLLAGTGEAQRAITIGSQTARQSADSNVNPSRFVPQGFRRQPYILTLNHRDAEVEQQEQQAPVSRLAKRKRIAEVMAEANARQKRLASPQATSPSLPGSALSSNHASPQPPAESHDHETPAVHAMGSTLIGQTNLTTPAVVHDQQMAGVTEGFTLEKTERASQLSTVNETSAADYDPTQDMNEDRPDHRLPDKQDNDTVISGPSESSVEDTQDNDKKEFDMFADEDDDDDMFAPLSAPRKAHPRTKMAPAAGLQHDYDDPDGYLRIIQREVLDGRYSIQTSLGKGVFASVVLADDVQTNTKVAIKIARNNDTMLKAAQHEVQFLTLLQDRDPSGKVPIIRLLHTFTHKKHFCLVFESLESDLRELLKKHGRNTGLDISAVKVYARQMFMALHHLEQSEVLHADLKPDNILVHQDNQYIKLCDLGSAMFLKDVTVTDMLVSRFYRAPEIMIGMPHSYAIDMWAIGCTLFELYTGRILFNGQDNNRMLRMIQECRGKIPSRMLKKVVQPTGHFSLDNTFIGEETNALTGKIVSKPIHFQQPVHGKDIRSRLAVGMPPLGAVSAKDAELRKLHEDFADLLDQCLKIDPEQRIKPAQALKHRMFQTPAVVAPTVKAPGIPFLPTSVLKRD